MKKAKSFLASLEKYGWRWIDKSPTPWSWIGVGIVGLALVASMLGLRASVVGIRGEVEFIERAAKVGDYRAARQWYERSGEKTVLGAATELETLVYPERRVEEEIKKYERLLEKYPNYRDLLLHLSDLCEQVGNEACRSEYWERARILDPNNLIFQKN